MSYNRVDMELYRPIHLGAIPRFFLVISILIGTFKSALPHSRYHIPSYEVDLIKRKQSLRA
jgi:hypothetical protein